MRKLILITMLVTFASMLFGVSGTSVSRNIDGGTVINLIENTSTADLSIAEFNATVNADSLTMKVISPDNASGRDVAIAVIESNREIDINSGTEVDIKAGTHTFKFLNTGELSGSQGTYITASSTNTLTNKSGNISQWTNDAGYITSAPNLISDLSDVNTNGATSGSLLQFDGTNWVNTANLSPDIINAVTQNNSIWSFGNDGIFEPIPFGSSGQYLRSNSEGVPSFENISYSQITGTPTIPSNLSDLGDVNTSGAANGNLLQYDGSIWTDKSYTAAGLWEIGTNLPIAPTHFIQFSVTENVTSAGDWRIMLDTTNDALVFERYNGSAWKTLYSINN